MRRLHPQPTRAFALIELPIALIFFGLTGLLVAWMVSSLPSPLPWYGWLFAFAIPPVAVFVTGLLFSGLADRHERAAFPVDRDFGSEDE